MGTVNVIFYAEGGSAPALDWLLAQPEKVQDKFSVVIELLEENGSTLKRPYAAPLRDKIYEQRVRWRRVNYRLLYFFHGNNVAVLAHGCTKEAQVDGADINRAIVRRQKFFEDPKGHTHGE